MSSNPTVLVGGQLKRWRVVMVAIGVLGYGLDQWTKAEAVARLDPYGPPSWFGGFLTLRLIRNPGAAFSMGSTVTVLISLFAIAMLIAVCVWGVPRARHRWSLIACGMLIAGICGNLTDRIFPSPWSTAWPCCRLHEPAAFRGIQRCRHIHHEHRHTRCSGGCVRASRGRCRLR